ncbi:diguanylate cyclase [Oceanispirochaeta crateris]|uniref:diguanylate cyclase n=1 Tax=Oceanispirochaeta crateris TaxID=2518645 RepID=A0A5C1QRA6_9SPIO|nr:diguanylate cyclase [Oceanispirochaeta crateris]QEN09739.1 diguanylate cyclase [Oceanispirochaeta crateris]
MKNKTIQTTALTFILLTIMGVVSGFLIHQFLLERYQAEERELVREFSGSIRASMESTLSNDLNIVHSMAAYLSVHPDVTQEGFKDFASQIFRDSTTLTNLAAAPNLVLTYVYPVAGNESILGVDFRDIPEQLPLVNKARESGDLVVAGPVDLVQGGQGILGRAPVFYEDKGNIVFWGIVSSLISFDSLIDELLPFLDKYNLKLSVRGINGSGAWGRAFFGNDDLFEEENGIQSMVMFPNGSWQIAVAPVDGWHTGHRYHFPVIFSIAIFVVFVTVFVFIRSHLNEKIRENEMRLDDITKASSDIIWETDRFGVLRYVSGKGESLLGITRDKLIGYSIFDFISTEKDPNSIMTLRDLMEARKAIVDYEVWLKTADPQPVCVLRNAIPLFEHRTQELIGYRGVDKNISLQKNLQLELEENANLLDLFFKQSLDGFFFMMLDEPVEWNDSVDKDAVLDYVFKHQRVTKINKALLQQYRASEEDFLGLTPTGFFAHDYKMGRHLWRKLFDEGQLHIDTDEKRFDGSSVTFEGDYIILFDGQGRITGHFGVQRDVTIERDREFQLQRYIAINDKNIIISQTNLDGIITYASDAFCLICGYAKEELVGQSHNIIRHPEVSDKIYKELWETISSGKTWYGEFKNKKKDGSFYWVNSIVLPVENRHGERFAYMSVRQDITAKKELEILSVTDRLTGLFNRQKLDRSLEEQRLRFSRYGEIFSVILLDIDHFKSVNDKFGHLEGDRILKCFSQIIQGQIRKTDIAGRWGGEEFLILCPHTDLDGAVARAEEIRRSIEEYDFGLGRSVLASFGVAQVAIEISENPEEDHEVNHPNEGVLTSISIHMITDQLLRSADAALYKAKEEGRNRVVRAL